MSSPELTEWIAFERIAGPVVVAERIDLGAALVALMVAKLGGYKGRRLDEFLPRWDRERDLMDAWNELEREARRDAHD
jgi:hypothetical protein